MRIDNYKKYKFKDYPVLGILTELDFTDTSNIKIIPHEEIENQIEGNDLNLVNSFEPLLFCTDFPDLNFTDNQGIDIDYLTLLDGHHRSVTYKHLRAHETEADLVCRLLL